MSPEDDIPDGEKAPPRAKGEFRPGDIVSLTHEALKSAPRLMGPVKLYSVGWPNFFQVIHVFERDDKLFLTIGACCYNLLMNRKNNARLCSGHEAKWFKLVFAPGEQTQEAPKPEGEAAAPPPARERKPGDRVTSLELPLVGEMVALEYQEDERNPSMILRVLGQKFLATGEMARGLKKFGQANGFL